MANKILISLIRHHALANYEKSYGWSEVIEAWDDEAIAEVIGDAATSNEAINRMQRVVDLKDQRFREAIGPDVECKTCGTMFGENTACPNGH